MNYQVQIWYVRLAYQTWIWYGGQKYVELVQNGSDSY